MHLTAFDVPPRMLFKTLLFCGINSFLSFNLSKKKSHVISHFNLSVIFSISEAVTSTKIWNTIADVRIILKSVLETMYTVKI